MKILIRTNYVDEMVNLHFGYYSNDSITIRGRSLNGEPLFTATVALDEMPSEGCIFLKGWSENEGIPEALVNAGIVKFTGRKVQTGYCEAIEARLLQKPEND